MNGRQSQPLSKALKHLLSTTDTINIAKCESLLYHCANTKSVSTTKKVHAYTVRTGLLSSHHSTHLLSLLTAAYAIGGQILLARTLFDRLPQRTLRSYKSVIRMYAENGSPRTALKLFVEMLESGHPGPDKYTYPFVIRACGHLLLLELGIAVHGLALTSGYGSDTFIENSLLAMYMNCGDMKGAKRVFEAMREHTVVSWNTMISGYFRNDCAKEALMMFQKLIHGGLDADCATILSVLPACSYLKNLEAGREVHLLAEQKGLEKKLSVRNALVDMYAKCGEMDEAQLVFGKMIDKDVITWTTMVNGYISNGDVNGAIKMCQLMQFEGIRPNAVTLASLLAACASLPDLKLGKCFHGWAIRHKIESDVNVETALIDLYAKCNCISLSLQVLSKTSKKKTVPWNALLSGCILNEQPREAIKFFKQMLFESVNPNEATFKSLLPAYAMEADLQQAMNIHSYLIRAGFFLKTEIATGLVDVYSKAGSFECGHKIFNGILPKNRDIVLWGAIIAGYAMHGRGRVALSLFYEMVMSGIMPNEVTFTSVLHGCSHGGSVDDGWTLFNFMKETYPVCLRTNHYACMVDLLGRAGRLQEAYELIKSMPFQPSHTVWGALLGACVIHENVELGEEAAKWVFELEPDNTGNYVLLSNIYAAVGRFEDAEKMRHVMKNLQLLKSPAQSVLR